MLKIRNFVQETSSDGKMHGVAEISVNDSSELVTEVGDYVFEDGSVAWAISEASFYGLTGGSWILQTSSSAEVGD